MRSRRCGRRSVWRVGLAVAPPPTRGRPIPGGELRRSRQGLGRQYRRRTDGVGVRHSPTRSRGIFVDNPACNNWADIGLPEVYNDPDLASFNGAVAQESATDDDAPRQAGRRRIRHQRRGRPGVPPGRRPDVGCSGQTTPMHLDDGAPQVWSFTGGAGIGHRRRLGQAGGGHRPALLQSRPDCGRTFCYRRKCANRATADRGERTGRGDAEHTGAVAAARLGTRHRPVTRKSRDFVGVIWKMDEGGDAFRDPEGMVGMTTTIASDVGETHPIEPPTPN